MGESLTVSPDGPANGIMWGLDNIANIYHGPTRLYAYNAANLAPLFDSSTNPADQAGGAVKFTVPAVAGGEVFVGTANELDIYGLLATRPRGGPIPTAILQPNYARQLHRTP